MKIRTVGVIGCGFMGAGIIQVCAQAGYDVITCEVDEDRLQKGMGAIEHHLGRSVEKNRITRQEKEAIQARIRGTLELDQLKDCDIIIEVIPEKIELKQELFRVLDSLCSENTILASNTSTIRIAEIASVTDRPEKVIGTHFLSPVPPSKLMEIVRPSTTSDETLQIVRAFIESLGKKAIVTRDTPGFIFNHLLGALNRAALQLLEKGIATAEDIDKSMTMGLGHPIGPLALMDFNGIDVMYLTQQAIYEQTKDPYDAPSPLIKKMYDEGRLGRKSGSGFFEYTS